MGIELPQSSAAAARLFATFSRFEFALKECGYVRADRYGGAQLDWNRFAAIEGLAALMQRLHDEGSVAELLKHPPRQQRAAGTHWEWADAPPITDAKAFLEAIKRVRNNLFHGGKAGADPRDDQLCKDAVACLVALLDLNPDVRLAFVGQY